MHGRKEASKKKCLRKWVYLNSGVACYGSYRGTILILVWGEAKVQRGAGGKQEEFGHDAQNDDRTRFNDGSPKFLRHGKKHRGGGSKETFQPGRYLGGPKNNHWVGPKAGELDVEIHEKAIPNYEFDYDSGKV